jgi:di/tricarboxylate transporter
VIGLRDGREVCGHGLLRERLTAGDTLPLVGFWPDIRRLPAATADFAVTNVAAELDGVSPVANRGPRAVGILPLVVALMVSGQGPNVQAALIGRLLMVLFERVDRIRAYRAIGGKILMLIIGMLPFSLALQGIHGVDLGANGLRPAATGAAPVNTRAIGPGTYTFGDFARIGVPLSPLAMIASVLLVPLLLPLRATGAPY